MSDDQLRLLVSTSLQALKSSGKVLLPATATELLAKVIAYKPPSGLFVGLKPPRLRLTDLRRFESILESLSQSWDAGYIQVSTEGSEGLCVMEIRLGKDTTARDASSGTSSLTRKRKRIVDEDADSAAGYDDEEEEVEENSIENSAETRPLKTTLDNLSKELKEVYALLQRGTAKGKLLAEQVRSRLAACYSLA